MHHIKLSHHYKSQEQHLVYGIAVAMTANKIEKMKKYHHIIILVIFFVAVMLLSFMKQLKLDIQNIQNREEQFKMMNIAEIVSRYENIKFETIKNKMILTFYIENRIYKILEIQKHKRNFKILILPNNIKKVIKLEELEELILSIEKQNIEVNQDVDKIKKKYKVGMKVRLIKMYDYISPIPPLTTGIIENIDDMGTLHILWENGKIL